MTKRQIHAFNWFFLFIIAGITGLHILTAVLLGAAIGLKIYIYLVVFAVIWFVSFMIQLKAFGTEKGKGWLVFSAILTGVWAVVYIYLNGA
ncbi:MAG TPA: hypothetical protein VF149_04760 [Bacillales bacterium]